MTTTITESTVSPIKRHIDDDGFIVLQHDEATLTGPNGTTRCTGCVGLSPSGRYRVSFTYKRGIATLRSSEVVEAATGIEAALVVAQRGGGGYLTCEAGTAEAN